MFGETKRRDVRLLLAAEVPQERIATLTGVSARAVRRIAKERAGRDPAQPGTKPRRKSPGRPSVAAPCRETVAERLAADPQMKGPEVPRRLKERG